MMVRMWFFIVCWYDRENIQVRFGLRCEPHGCKGFGTWILDHSERIIYQPIVIPWWYVGSDCMIWNSHS